MIEFPNFRMDDDEDEDGEEGEKEKSSSPAAMTPPAEQALFKARAILVFGTINDKLAREVTGRLLALAHQSEDPIRLFIGSPGGHVESGDTIHDMLNFITAPVTVIGTGWVASAAAHIFLGVPKERRLCLPNTRFMLHQPSGGVRGPAGDIDIEAREIIKMRERINQVISRETGQPLDRVKKDTDRNFWMSAEEALDYGMVGRIINSMSEI